jgi:hypothetical protein
MSEYNERGDTGELSDGRARLLAVRVVNTHNAAVAFTVKDGANQKFVINALEESQQLIPIEGGMIFENQIIVDVPAGGGGSQIFGAVYENLEPELVTVPVPTSPVEADPNMGARGAGLKIDITYTSSILQFPKDMEADFGANIVVSKSQRIALKKVRAWITIGTGNIDGARDVTIRDKGGNVIGTKTDGFTIT